LPSFAVAVTVLRRPSPSFAVLRRRRRPSPSFAVAVALRRRRRRRPSSSFAVLRRPSPPPPSFAVLRRRHRPSPSSVFWRQKIVTAAFSNAKNGVSFVGCFASSNAQKKISVVLFCVVVDAGRGRGSRRWYAAPAAYSKRGGARAAGDTNVDRR